MAKIGNTHKPITHWTPMHMLSGVIMQKSGLTTAEALMASIAFELVENTVGVKAGIIAPEGGNNMALDVVFNMTGYYLGTKI